MPVAEVRGARIAYDDSGGDGPPVILAHGFLMDRGMFAPQVEALRGTHRVITWDQRGFGDTEFDDQPFTYWDSAEDCLGLLDHLGVDRAVVGGMSQGGFVSLRAALLAPERVRGLVLLNTQAGTEDAEVIPLYEGLLAEWSTDGPSDETCALVASIILGEPELTATYTARWKASPPAAIRQPGATLLGRDSIEDRLGEIAAPALVVHGDADAAIALPKAERLAAGLPDAELVVVAGGTHASNLTHPTEVNEAIVRFLSALPST